MAPSDPLHVVVAWLGASPLRFEVTDCTLHVTVIPAFTLRADEETIHRIIRRVAGGIRPFTITGVEKAMFGPAGDVPVRRVDSAEIVAAHRALAAELSGLISFIEPSYAGDGYLPHATDQRNARLDEGETEPVNSISLVRIEGPWAEIVDTYALTGR
jgi:hypothetical protein